jgi:hypothetical protein
MNISVGSGVIIEPGVIDGGGISNIAWCKESPDLRLLRAPTVGVTDTGAAANADAIGDGADDIGRAQSSQQPPSALKWRATLSEVIPGAEVTTEPWV